MAPCAWACTRQTWFPALQVAKAYGATEVAERHRHRYEVNNEYREQLEEAGLRISGTSPDSSLVEYVELPAEAHPTTWQLRHTPSTARVRLARTRSSPA